MHMRYSMGWLLCCGLLGCQTAGSATAGTQQAAMEFKATGGIGNSAGWGVKDSIGTGER